MINLHHIDNMEFMATKPDKYYDLAVVDPPYFDGPNKLGYYSERTSSIGVKREEYKKLSELKSNQMQVFS
jgi:site-specific DNA-methyltransferase (adenine-specific)